MSSSPSARTQDHFASLSDPRRRKVIHPLINIVAIAIRAVVAGADDFATIAAWGRRKRAWLAKVLDLSAGIPSHDRFNAVFKSIKPAEFEKRLPSWITAPREITAGQVVAIDGETSRHGFDKATGKSAIHMVSAWAAANRLSLGQVIVDQKSDEITAIPKPLELLEIAGRIATIDAMGRQTAIAEAIVARKADYVLAAKENQPTSHAGIEARFLDHLDDDFARVTVGRYETHEHGHGRDEHRAYHVCDVPDDLPDRSRWKGLKRIGAAISDTIRDGKSVGDARYHILSRKTRARSFAAAVRGHWSIENQPHWQLDVTFGEDQRRAREGHADANLSILRRTAPSLLKNEETQKVGVKTKRLTAAWNDDYLEQVLFGT